MPQRNLSFEAVVLRSRESPGGDRIVTFLAAEAGILDAFVFGGPKNRLRSLAAPYHSGTAWIYGDPVKDFRKLTDFDARETYPTLRENLRKIWTASYFAETVLRTDAAGGESRAVYELLREGLSALDAGGEADVDYAGLQYGWRLLDLMGLRPDPADCSRCGAPLGPGRGGYFSRTQEAILCSDCHRGESPAARAGGLPLGGGALRYLAAAGALPFRDSLRVRASPEDLPVLKGLVFHLVRSAAEGELRTLERGELL